jgi:hypothetical protein
MKKFCVLLVLCFNLISVKIGAAHTLNLTEQASFFGPIETIVHGRVNTLTGAQVCQESAWAQDVDV